MASRWLLSPALVVLAACGSSSVQENALTFIAWPGNANGADVTDANGAVYRFDATTGCMYAVSTGIGPTGFCLTKGASAPSGFAAYGATECASPTTNPVCNVATFDVVLTANPTGSGCIAVLGSGGATALQSTALAVTSTGGGFDIQTSATAGAYKVYWNAVIPVCGGSSRYAGSYTSTTTSAKPSGYVVTGTGCAIASSVGSQGGAPSQNNGAPFLSLTVDSGGIIDNDSLQITGTIASDGTGSFALPSLGSGSSCTPTFTIQSAAAASSTSWTLAGTEAFAGTSFPFSLGD